MSGFIELDPKKGVNPKLCFCPRCGGEAEELVLMGRRDYVDECQSCGMKIFGGLAYKTQHGQSVRECPRCVNTHFVRKRMSEYDKVPASQPCAKCKEELAAAHRVVEEGGVYWKCETCRTEGVIKADNHLAIEVREKSGIKPPLPVGLTLTKEECPFCRTEQ